MDVLDRLEGRPVTRQTPLHLLTRRDLEDLVGAEHVHQPVPDRSVFEIRSTWRDILRREDQIERGRAELFARMLDDFDGVTLHCDEGDVASDSEGWSRRGKHSWFIARGSAPPSIYLLLRQGWWIMYDGDQELAVERSEQLDRPELLLDYAARSRIHVMLRAFEDNEPWLVALVP